MNEEAKLERVFAYPFGDIYSNYVAKVERKGHTREELDDILGWFTQLSPAELQDAAESEKTLREFFRRPRAYPERGVDYRQSVRSACGGRRK